MFLIQGLKNIWLFIQLKNSGVPRVLIRFFRARLARCGKQQNHKSTVVILHSVLGGLKDHLFFFHM